MIKECWDCKVIKRGCEPIKFVTPPYKYLGLDVKWMDKVVLGMFVCRACNNFAEYRGHYSTEKPVKSYYCEETTWDGDKWIL